MAGWIEDYGLIGDTQTAALVGRDGSIDWLCLPRFDSGACFAALLGDERNGRWLLRPAGDVTAVQRRYRPATMILETEISTASGTVRLVDFMPPRGTNPDVVRIVEGVSGTVDMAMQLIVRFDYGAVVPWVRRAGDALRFVGGPDALELHTPVRTHGQELTTVARFRVEPGDRVPFVLTWHPSHEPPPARVDPFAAYDDTASWWEEWAGQSTYDGRWAEEVERSLLVLKAMTYAPTGGIVAAPTTSLPEQLGGARNWDYRYCWLRDATLTLMALMGAGYDTEAVAWRDWLLRAVAGDPRALQIMYGPAGERRLVELELPWLPGYEGSAPVRIGNAAAGQFQLDVYGELMDALHQSRRAGVETSAEAWSLQQALIEYLESVWDQPDDGIWEVRGGRRHFTLSRVMAWVAIDRAVRGVELFGLDGPLERWKALRHQIRSDVLTHGYDAGRATFTQYYGSAELDASLLLIPLVGFLPPDDERVIGTVDAIERELLSGGFVQRYSIAPGAECNRVDGLPGGEGAFLACSFWLADAYHLIGRQADAEALFERLLGLANDVGLLAEEYDPVAGRMVGNFPQAFSHVGLINTARNLSPGGGPAHHRRGH